MMPERRGRVTMNNYKLTIDLQLDSHDTARDFSEVLSHGMMAIASATIDICTHQDAVVVLGKTILRTSDTFEPNT